MRCEHCNVNLDNGRKTCPLCGKPAVKAKREQPLITAPYPEYKKQQTADKNKKKKPA